MSCHAKLTTFGFAVVLFASGCSGSSGSASSGSVSSESSSDAGSATTAASEPTSSEPTSTTVPDAVAVTFLPMVELNPTEAGPRPTLSWSPVDGAVRYTLVVLGVDGEPYWAWSGEESSVPMGGIEDPDVVGPWVHEPMTWTVAASDASGAAIALSQVSILTP